MQGSGCLPLELLLFGVMWLGGLLLRLLHLGLNEELLLLQGIVAGRRRVAVLMHLLVVLLLLLLVVLELRQGLVRPVVVVEKRRRRRMPVASVVLLHVGLHLQVELPLNYHYQLTSVVQRSRHYLNQTGAAVGGCVNLHTFGRNLLLPSLGGNELKSGRLLSTIHPFSHIHSIMKAHWKLHIGIKNICSIR